MIPIVAVNTDSNVPPKFFADAAHLYVTSIFRTIQGEGPYAGYPSVFVRLAGCNFGAKTSFCSFCDTNFQIDKAQCYSPQGLINLLRKVPGRKASDILVITGGEPMLQPLIISVLTELQADFRAFQFETNGTQAAFIEKLLASPANAMTQVVVSPKANLVTRGYAPLKGSVLGRTDALKFVVSADPESPHHSLPAWAFEARAQHSQPDLYVSPMAVYKRAPVGEVSSIWDDTLIDREATAANYRYAAEYAMEHSLLLSLQTHLFTAVP